MQIQCHKSGRQLSPADIHTLAVFIVDQQALQLLNFVSFSLSYVLVSVVVYYVAKRVQVRCSFCFQRGWWQGSS